MERTARYADSLLIAVGWYTVLAAAVIVGTLGVPDPPPDPDGCGFFGCMTSGQAVRFWLGVLGLPVGLGLLAVSALVVAVVRRVVASALIAGTVTAAVSLGLGLLVLHVLAAGG